MGPSGRKRFADGSIGPIAGDSDLFTNYEIILH